MDVKRCPRCDTIKPVDEFHRWAERDGRQVWCKACRRVYDAEYHRRTWGPRRRAQKRALQRGFTAWYQSLKAGRPCADCGLVFPPEAMHWDHLPGSVKRANLSDLARSGSRPRVLEELAKCELVCSNCHAVRTVRRLGA